jgi:hypothetical protein
VEFSDAQNLRRANESDISFDSYPEYHFTSERSNSDPLQLQDIYAQRLSTSAPGRRPDNPSVTVFAGPQKLKETPSPKRQRRSLSRSGNPESTKPSPSPTPSSNEPKLGRISSGSKKTLGSLCFENERDWDWSDPVPEEIAANVVWDVETTDGGQSDGS